MKKNTNKFDLFTKSLVGFGVVLLFTGLVLSFIYSGSYPIWREPTADEQVKLAVLAGWMWSTVLIGCVIFIMGIYCDCKVRFSKEKS